MLSPLSVFAAKKRSGEKIAMISLYDAPSAQIACDAGADALLVGDSLGNVILGYPNTIPVTMEDMKRHTAAVVRGVAQSGRKDVPVVADLPFGSYATIEDAVKNSVALMQLGAHAVKLEGTTEGTPENTITKLIQNGIPVMGHLGFTPQSLLTIDGVVQGKTLETAWPLISSAKFLSQSGCFAVVLEAVVQEVAALTTQVIEIATIGIGSGAECDGQVLVWNDLVGITPKTFRFVQRYAETRSVWASAAESFITEVQASQFPLNTHAWQMEPDKLEELRHHIKDDSDWLDSADDLNPWTDVKLP